VLRCFDYRFRNSGRSDVVYRDGGNIVDGVVEVIKMEPNPADINDWEDFPRGKNATGALSLISIPYLLGKHVATRPKAFLPIIDHLVAMHQQGLVHGDIRACNTVLHYDDTTSIDDNPKGWLIDFDLGGRVGIAKYPDGYNVWLPDGLRVDVPSGANIEKWHDWFALGQLIFHAHEFTRPIDREITSEEEAHVGRMEKFWLNIKERPRDSDAYFLNKYSYDDDMDNVIRNQSGNVTGKKNGPTEDADTKKAEHPSDEHIAALKQFLLYTNKHGYILEPADDFDKLGDKNETIFLGTGSPQENKRVAARKRSRQ
jgi:Lipopolysaccharide kinase (Kdo/WaaP) family